MVTDESMQPAEKAGGDSNITQKDKMDIDEEETSDNLFNIGYAKGSKANRIKIKKI